MSDTLQPGLQLDQAHPDADQLTAFAEHALPLHEHQQTLAHLATCTGCRQIVYLAQQAVEAEAAAPEPMLARKPWFSGWNLVWPAALALAGVVAFSVHFRNFSKPATGMKAVTTATVEPQSLPAAPAPPAAGEPNRNVTPKKKEAAAPIVVPRASAGTMSMADVTPHIPTQRATQRGSAHGAAAGVEQASVGVAAPTPPPAGLGAINRMQLGAVRSGVARQALTSEVAAKDRLPQDKAAADSYALAERAALPAAKPSQPSPAPPAPQAAPVTAASESVTVDVSNAMAIATQTSSSLAMLALHPTLPSHLPAESTASLGLVTLALDSQGKLFLSKDQGRHWKQVKAAWEGRAAKIGTATQASPGMFALTTGAGDVWTSPDGQHWKRP